MTFKEKYDKCKTWHEKIFVIEIFHLTMRDRNKNWRVRDTANEFGISLSLCSENLSIADAIHKDAKLLEATSRTDVLRKLKDNYGENYRT